MIFLQSASYGQCQGDPFLHSSLSGCLQPLGTKAAWASSLCTVPTAGLMVAGLVFGCPRDVLQTGREGAALTLWRFVPLLCQLGNNTKRFQQSTWLNQRWVCCGGAGWARLFDVGTWRCAELQSQWSWIFLLLLTQRDSSPGGVKD